MEQLVSSADPAIAFIGFLQTIQALPERPLSQPRVFVSYRMADVTYAERIAWQASRKAGLGYWLDVHDPVLRLASAALPPGQRCRAEFAVCQRRVHKNTLYQALLRIEAKPAATDSTLVRLSRLTETHTLDELRDRDTAAHSEMIGLVSELAQGKTPSKHIPK